MERERFTQSLASLIDPGVPCEIRSSDIKIHPSNNNNDWLDVCSSSLLDACIEQGVPEKPLIDLSGTLYREGEILGLTAI